MNPPVLVTGGAGYIGSHVVLGLRDIGWPVVVLDDLSTGLAEAIPADVPSVCGSTGDFAVVCKTACKSFQIPGVNSVQKFPPRIMRSSSI